MKIVGYVTLAIACAIVGTVVERKYSLTKRVMEEYDKAKAEVEETEAKD